MSQSRESDEKCNHSAENVISDGHIEEQIQVDRKRLEAMITGSSIHGVLIN